MKEIKKYFENMKEMFPNHSDFVLFVRTIRFLKTPPDLIQKSLNKLVDKNDYKLSEKRRILKWLEKGLKS